MQPVDEEMPASGALSQFLSGQAAGPIPQELLPDLLCTIPAEWFEGPWQANRWALRLARYCDGATWAPPVLRIEVERHAGIVNGGTRAEVQTWELDPQSGTATLKDSRGRQLYPSAPRFNTKALADELAPLILAGVDDPRLKWSKDHSAVSVNYRAVVELAVGYKATLEGRRTRLENDLDGRIGWKRIGRRLWQRPLDAEE